MTLTELKQNLQSELQKTLSQDMALSDLSLKEKIDEQLRELPELSLTDRLYLKEALYNSFRRLDLLSELLDDKSISEIMINSPTEVFVERDGRMEQYPLQFTSGEQLENLIQQIVSRINRVVNRSRPIVDARLEDGSRVHVVLPPIALKGPTLTIRKFPEPITMQKLIQYESLTEEAAAFLKDLVRKSYNIFISGGTNSGKTTFLNALSQFIPADERVITIEDSAELQLRGIKNLVAMETRDDNAEGEGKITISDLIRASLRMSPRRIIVGEVRGKECLVMLNAMNTGHDGSLSTGHANSAKDMCKRMETMILQGADLPLSAIRGMIASAIQIMIHLGRTEDHRRRVLEICEVIGVEHEEITLHTLYRYQNGTLRKISEPTGNKDGH